MEIVPEIGQPRRALGLCVMTVVPLLQLATEYLGTGDLGRVLSKLAVSMIGLPILIWGSPAGIRWAAGRRSGPLLLLFGGMLSAGALYAALLAAVHLASLHFAALRPATGARATSAALRIGFAMGLTNFGLWVLAFIFPFAFEDARFRALEARQLRTAAGQAPLASRAPLLAQHAQRRCRAGDRGRARSAPPARLAGRPLARFAPRRTRDADPGRADRLAAALRAHSRGAACRASRFPLGGGPGSARGASATVLVATPGRERGEARRPGTQEWRHDRSASHGVGREKARLHRPGRWPGNAGRRDAPGSVRSPLAAAAAHAAIRGAGELPARVFGIGNAIDRGDP